MKLQVHQCIVQGNSHTSSASQLNKNEKHGVVKLLPLLADTPYGSIQSTPSVY